MVEDLTQILASQRLEAWKEAVERVIHEIKNPLTPVGLAGETLKTAWASDPARFAEVFPSAIDMILGAVRDLKELIGEFSRFSRLPPMRPERLDPNGLVRAVLAPYTKAPPERVRVTTELAADAPEVEADADQIKRVLLNVINNALEAMGEKGGTLRLSTRRERGGVLILRRGRRAGRRGRRAYLRAALHDQGEGHRPRPRDRAPDRRGARRHHPRRKPARARHPRAHLPSRRSATAGQHHGGSGGCEAPPRIGKPETGR